MIKDQHIDYAVITKSVSKLGKVTGLKHKQKGNDNKLTWSAVDGAGYYKVYHYDEYNKKERAESDVFTGSQRTVYCQIYGTCIQRV